MNSGRLSASVIESNVLRGSEKNLNWVRKSVKQVDVAFSYSSLRYRFFHISGLPEIWKFSLIGFGRHIVWPGSNEQAHTRGGYKILSGCLRPVEIFGLETIRTTGTAGTIGTGLSEIVQNTKLNDH